MDYVPADTNVVFGHQFASIAGAGPINGPIQAAIFGWLPVMLWILIGGYFSEQFRILLYVCLCKEAVNRISLNISENWERNYSFYSAGCSVFWLLQHLQMLWQEPLTLWQIMGTVTRVAANGAVATTSIKFIIRQWDWDFCSVFQV